MTPNLGRVFIASSTTDNNTDRFKQLFMSCDPVNNPQDNMMFANIWYSGTGKKKKKVNMLNNQDKFGKELAIGDRIIVCFDKDGWLSRATIIGESEKKWIIEEEAYYNHEIIHKRRMDKNPKRIIKYVD